jgi:hypothetical protein
VPWGENQVTPPTQLPFVPTFQALQGLSHREAAAMHAQIHWKYALHEPEKQ